MEKTKNSASMSVLMFVLSVVITLNGYTQTKVIAHKSRGGSMAFFSASKGMDNIGETPEMMRNLKVFDDLYPSLDTIVHPSLTFDSILRLNDSLLIYIPRHNNFVRETLATQTLFSEQELTIDSMRLRAPDIIFVGFDSIDQKPTLQDSANNESSKVTDEKQEQNSILPIIDKPQLNKKNNAQTLILSVGLIILIIISINLLRLKNKPSVK